MRICIWLQIEGEFPEILGIRESLIKHVFEPAALQVGLATYNAAFPYIMSFSYPCIHSVMLQVADSSSEEES